MSAEGGKPVNSFLTIAEGGNLTASGLKLC